MRNLSYIEAKINVDGLSSDKTYNVTLTKPAGVKTMSESNVTVTVKLETESSREISGVSVKPINLGDKLKAQAASLEDQTITVIVKGANSALQNIEAKDIIATVDLSGYNTGTYDVAVNVSSSDIRLSLTPKVSSVKVRIVQDY